MPKRSNSLARKVLERERRKSAVISATLKRDRSICQCCYFSAYRSDVHHIHRIDLGGKDREDNAIVLCFECHRHVPKYPQDFLEYQRQGGHLGKIFFNQELTRATKDFPDVSLRQFKTAYDTARFSQFEQLWRKNEANEDPITDEQLARLEALLEGRNSVSTAEFEAAMRGDDPIEAEIFALSCDRPISQPSTPPQSRRKGKRSKSVTEGQLALF